MGPPYGKLPILFPYHKGVLLLGVPENPIDLGPLILQKFPEKKI